MQIFKFLLLTALLIFSSCGGGSSSDLIDEIDDIDDIDDIANDPSRKQIDTSRMGINAFGNEGAFGDTCAQFLSVKRDLKLKYIRILMRWDTNVQPTPASAIDYGFYDTLANCIPAGVEALIVTTGIPSWMSSSANWIDNNPRKTFAEKWLRPLVQRYSGNARITAWQIWNEPNMLVDNENVVMQVVDSPENYVELLGLSYSIIKDIAPNKIVLNAATTAIAQNFPDSLRYNQRMKDAGGEQFVDVWAVHYYGKQFAKFLSGVKNFLNELNRPIWITESGEQGTDKQLAYVETAWPYLQENLPKLDRIYYYQHTSTVPADNSFALLTTTPGKTNSDLYAYLVSR